MKKAKTIKKFDSQEQYNNRHEQKGRTALLERLREIENIQERMKEERKEGPKKGL